MKVEFDEITGVVTLETAKFIKENGFKYPTYFFYLDKNLSYVEKGLKRVKFSKRRLNHNKFDDFIYSAPDKNEIKKFLKQINYVHNS